MGKIPALVDGAVVVTEVAAICAYLADRYPEKGFAPPPGSRERGRYYRHLSDVVFGGTLDFAVQFGWLEAPSARVVKYVGRIKDRPAYKQSHDPLCH